MLTLQINPLILSDSDVEVVQTVIQEVYKHSYTEQQIRSAAAEIVFVEEQDEITTYPDDHYEGL